VPRPDRLPPSARGVVERSTILPAGVKLVWIKTHVLDDPTEGAWVSAPALADQLGMKPATVERYRHFLLRAGLLARGPRSGRRGVTWYPTLPDRCVPPARGASKQQIAEAGQALDQHLRQLQGSRANPDDDPGQLPLAIPEPSPGQNTAPSRMMIRDEAEAMGGLQGGLVSRERTESPLVSVVTECEEKPMVATPQELETKKRRAGSLDDPVMRRLMRTWHEKRVAP